MCKTYSKEWIFLKEKKKLNIKGTVLDRYQLEQYLEKIASDHILIEKSAKDTYPIPRLKENFFVIKEIYKLLNEQIKQGIPIHPAGEWILDNLYVIEEIYRFSGTCKWQVQGLCTCLCACNRNGSLY